MVGVGAFCLLLLVSAVKSEIVVEEGVLVLTTDNFQEALDQYPLMLVEFYAPWCGHCKKLAPEYESAAKTLEEAGSTVKLAKVDATENKGLANNHGVKGYPTLKFFQHGEPSEYTGGRTADTLVTWLNKKSGPAAVTLNSLGDVEEIVGKNQVVVLGFFKDAESDEAKAYLQAAAVLDDQLFAITSVKEAYSKFAVSGDNGVILLKKFDEGRNTLEGDITVDSVKTFVLSNALPLVVDFNSETAKMIFGQQIQGHFMIFSSAEDEKHEHRIHTARKIAKDYKGKVMFVSVTTDEKEHQKVLEFFGIVDVPTYRIANVMEDFVKYKPETSDFSEESLRGFIEKYLAGELSPDLKSEALPEDWDATPVKVLVSKNFEEVAMEEGKDVLVEFYAPWCGHCKKLTPIWDELGEKFKDIDDVVIAKMDSTANEVLQVKIRGFPTIKLFKKDNTIVDYAGDRTLNSFVKFLRPEMAEPEVEAEPAASEEPEKKDEL